MAFRLFQSVFYKILVETPLPYGDKWKLQTLEKAGMENCKGWFDILYRTKAKYQCSHGHFWKSSWSMILFRIHLGWSNGFGRVRMKRFGQRCQECPEDVTYHLGLYEKGEVWTILQCLLLYILQTHYEGRNDDDVDSAAYIIPVSDVPNGKFGGAPHRKDCCEGCAHDRCQDAYLALTGKKQNFVASRTFYRRPPHK